MLLFLRIFSLLLLFSPLCLLTGISTPLSDVHNKKDSTEQSKKISDEELSNAHYLDIGDAKLASILTDTKERIDDNFSVPDEIKPEVLFWVKVYAKFSIYQTIIYDRTHPDTIYEIVDNTDLFNKGMSAVQIEILERQRVSSSVQKYRSAIQKLLSNPKYITQRNPTIDRLRSIWGKKSASQWKEILANLRTQKGQRDRVLQGINNAELFFSPMESIFRKYGVPVELTRLSLVESSFNISANSKADAVGVWQFLEKSALEYIIVDKKNGIDERISPIKAAYAAAKLLKRNYKLLNDYTLAIISYNHGLKNLLKVKKKYAGNNIVKLLTKKKNNILGFASRNYYFEFLAMLYVERYRDVFFGLPVNIYTEDQAISIVKLKKSVSIFDISSKYHISIYVLKLFNPDIFKLYQKLRPGTRIVIPRKIADSLVQNQSELFDYDKLDLQHLDRSIASEE